mgnify:CR=1 FL=1
MFAAVSSQRPSSPANSSVVYLSFFTRDSNFSMSVPAPSKALASIFSLKESLRASTAARTYSVLSLVLEALFFIVAKFYSKASKAAISDIDVYNTSMALFVSVI